jgi:hypothetical protein
MSQSKKILIITGDAGESFEIFMPHTVCVKPVMNP